MVFLEVGGSCGSEDDAGDDEHVEEDGEDGGELLGVAVIAGAVDCSFTHYMLVMYIYPLMEFGGLTPPAKSPTPQAKAAKAQYSK